MSKGKLSRKGSKGSLVDVASFDFRTEEMNAAAEFRRDYFQSRFFTAQKFILIFTHLSFDSECEVTIFAEKRMKGVGKVEKDWSTAGLAEKGILSISEPLSNFKSGCDKM